ncbi:hypothetical protein FF100_04735 [Methylobacterium terricola]|uniref:Uncharacterized protein n=1 Tax=Methylobacterium terricola TaxID=2583531 RepID=A0A5C4LLY6_9HYPH|nr:hypothetical protein [Methylobacterium terricola]TNC14888.1 hypothetical protein FF100_04735 [Methylobacterium terricola]
MSAMLDESAILSAKRLGLSEEELNALIQTRRMLAEAKIGHAPGEGMAGFNMNYQAKRWDCGAACCIGGHMSLLMQGVPSSDGVFVLTREEAITAGDYVNRREFDHVLSPLFFPRELEELDNDIGGLWDKITPEMAVRAIDSFLLTGNPNWIVAVSVA